MSHLDHLIECPHSMCQGGRIVINQNGTFGSDTDSDCPLCDGEGVFFTHDEVDQAWNRMGCCSICREAIEECYCPTVMPARLHLVADQPSPRERREHARVLNFPTNKKAAPGSHPDAA